MHFRKSALTVWEQSKVIHICSTFSNHPFWFVGIKHDKGRCRPEQPMALDRNNANQPRSLHQTISDASLRGSPFSSRGKRERGKYSSCSNDWHQLWGNIMWQLTSLPLLCSFHFLSPSPDMFLYHSLVLSGNIFYHPCPCQGSPSLHFQCQPWLI